jgi:xanthine dehydrogenase/oxidase
MPSFTKSHVQFELNGEHVTVEEPDPKAVLGDYLRLERGLTGLQMSCRQGGCGSCTVILSPIRCSSSDSSSSSSGKKKKNDAVHVAAANHADDDDEPLKHRPVNACLLPLCSVDGKRVTTVEGIGSTKHGLHPVQQAIVKHNGTQCGFCTPGMVMSMYGLVINNSQPTAQQVEDQLDGNLCRCTGYRPILDGFQTFANCNKNNNKRMCNKSGEQCTSGCDKEGDMEELGSKRMERQELPDARLMVSRDGMKWVRAVSLDELYALLQTTKHKGRTIRMVRGNTSSGIYPPPAVDVLADISRISKLMELSVQEKGISIGGAVPITDFMVLLERNQSLSPSYGPLLKHLKRVAHNQVRNIGSVAGNLMLTHAHGEFASDISTILMAAEAKLRVGFAWENGDEHVISLEQFFNLSLDGAVIVEIFIPVMKASARFFTYKVALRRANAHALFNAGFKLAVNSTKGVFESNCVIVYGGVRPYPQRARKTEAYLGGKKIFDPKVFADAVQILQRELVVDPALGRTEYRTRLLAAFLYKAFLSLFPQDTIPPRLRSSIAEYVRPVSQGEISFDEGDPSEYPVSKPIPKLSAGLQATGEAQYLDDMVVGGSLYATFVQATVANAALKSIDPSKALAMKGVATFISAASLKANKYCNLVRYNTTSQTIISKDYTITFIIHKI